MYSPKHVHDCDTEKKRVPHHKKRVTRKVVDTLMTGVGLVASVSSVPQVIKIFETETVAGISLTTQLLAFGAVVSWFFYGIYIKNKPLFITSGFTALVLGIVIVQIFIYG